ncbi:MAG: orotate phosphoribosyltransferase [Planctomycetota bacterium]
MPLDKDKVVSFLVEQEAVRFGDFTLKSGRKSPYFFNIGVLNSGQALLQLGRFYAELIMDTVGADFDLLFGPAYKGIPLAIVTAAAFSLDYSLSKSYFADRKEAKTHGDKSAFLGSEPNESNKRIVFIDDVFTTGGTKYEAIDFIRERHPYVEFLAVVIGVDRKEKSPGQAGAIQQFEAEMNIPVHSLISVDDIVEYLRTRGDLRYEQIEDYLKQYGV